MPTSTTAAPGRTKSEVTKPGRPIAATRMSASRQIEGKSETLRVADRHGGIARRQQRRHRLAHDLAAAENDSAAARERDCMLVEKSEDPGRSAGDKARPALVKQADVLRMEAVDVLQRVDGVEHAPRIVPGFERHLNEEAVDAVVPVAGGHSIQQRGRGGTGGQSERVGVEARFPGRLFLRRHVGLGRRVVASQNDPERRRHARPGRRPPLAPLRRRRRARAAPSRIRAFEDAEEGGLSIRRAYRTNESLASREPAEPAAQAAPSTEARQIAMAAFERTEAPRP